jgi:hypothetical protein
MFNSKQDKEIAERFEREKKFIDRELELYKEQKQLEVDANIHVRMLNNWKKVDHKQQ